MHNISRINRLSNQAGLPSHSEGRSYRKDLKKITKVELLEIYEREEKLLKNVSKLNRLPDKGQKIREYFAKVKAELESRNQIDQAAEQFSKLNIASVGRKALNNLEWTGKTQADVYVDSDDDPDDDTDPIKILANSNEQTKVVKELPPEKPLITEEDLKEIESFKSDPIIEEVGVKNKSRFTKILQKMDEKTVQDENDINKVAEILEPHAIYLCNIEQEKSSSPLKPKFLPSRTTKTDVHNPEKEKARKVQRNWEATAATPPLLKHGSVKTLTLEESIEVQRHQIEHVKKIQEEQTKERLIQRQIRSRDRTLMDNLINDAPFFSDYRDPNDSDVSDEHEFNSDDEVHDEPEEKGGVVYQVEGH